MMASLHREYGTPPDKKRAMLGAEVSRMCLVLDEVEGVISTRNKCVLLVDFAAALRVSELVKLRVCDVTVQGDIMQVVVRRSKTDQAGRGVWKLVVKGKRPCTDPILAFRDWMAAYEAMYGKTLPPDAPLFAALYPIGDRMKSDGTLMRSSTGKIVAMRDKRLRAVLKELAVSVDPNADPTKVGCHSLRSGFASTASANGARREDIAKQGNWKDPTAMEGYIRPSPALMDNSSGHLGL
jgi:integrase